MQLYTRASYTTCGPVAQQTGLNAVSPLNVCTCNFTNTTDAAAKRKSFEAEHGLRFLQRGRKTNSVQDLLNAEEIRTAEEEVRILNKKFLRFSPVNSKSIRMSFLMYRTAAATTVSVYIGK
jgi:hypothetical protein